MADALGGRVEVQSQLGVGSTFTLVLPIDGPSLADASHVQSGNDPDR
jgi:chemotaxis protein histidine kinase CheA